MIFAALCLLFSAIPTVVFLRNLAVYRSMPCFDRDPAGTVPGVSVLVPARNEERGIKESLQLALASDYPEFEIVVLDDHSTDRTATIVKELASTDERVRLETSDALPSGWCGKQHACWQLSRLAKHDLLMFIDADVHLTSEALRRAVQAYSNSEIDLLSCFPHQRTVSWLEKLLIPLIHFILLGFLSLRQMRARPEPAFAAGCGQFFLTSRSVYDRAGGHASIRESLHDGIRLPREYRKHGLKTDVFDGTDVASVRMYRNGSEVWQGLQKNATEGLGSPKIILPATILLLLGQVAPFVGLFLFGVSSPMVYGLLVLSVIIAWIPRWIAVFRFSQTPLGALFHPIGILLLLAIQWSALIRLWMGQGGSWKGRDYRADEMVSSDRS